MVDRDLVRRKLAELSEYVTQVSEYRDLTVERCRRLTNQFHDVRPGEVGGEGRVAVDAFSSTAALPSGRLTSGHANPRFAVGVLSSKGSDSSSCTTCPACNVRDQRERERWARPPRNVFTLDPSRFAPDGKAVSRAQYIVRRQVQRQP